MPNPTLLWAGLLAVVLSGCATTPRVYVYPDYTIVRASLKDVEAVCRDRVRCPECRCCWDASTRTIWASTSKCIIRELGRVYYGDLAAKCLNWEDSRDWPQCAG